MAAIGRNIAVNSFKRMILIGVLPIVLLGACGDSSEKKDDGASSVSKIVDATCSDLRNATSSAEAAQTLSYSMQLAAAIGLSNEQLGSLLSVACMDALNNANQRP